MCCSVIAGRLKPSGERYVSKLFYHGTDIEVMLGDRVRYTKGLFWRRAVSGRVCYMPGVSNPHPQLDFEGTRMWSIQLENGSNYAWIYCPEEVQPSWRIKFVARDGSVDGLLTPDEILK